jgi:hypothetical protein
VRAREHFRSLRVRESVLRHRLLIRDR